MAWQGGAGLGGGVRESEGTATAAAAGAYADAITGMSLMIRQMGRPQLKDGRRVT